MKIISLLFAFIFIFLTSFSAAHADTTFTVTAFDSQKNFTWVGGPVSGCSAINSFVMTSPGNDQASRLSACEASYGVSDNTIPDGTYYIQLVVGGVIWKSQTFTIQNGQYDQPLPTATLSPTQIPTPTSAPVNQRPIAVASTSLDANGNMQLDGSLSSDADNDPLTYFWKIMELKKTYSGQKVSLSDIPSGTYTVTLMVGDGHVQTGTTIKIGITSGIPKATVNMNVQNILVDKKEGTFLIKGEFDKKNALLNAVLARPSGRLLFEIQTGGTTAAPIYGVVGDDTQSLQTIDRILKYNY